MRHILVSLMLFCVILHPNSTQAQDTTTEDDVQAIIDRIIPLFEDAADYTSFFSVVNNLTERASTVNVPTLGFETQSVTNVLYSSVRAISFEGETPAGTAFSTIDVFDAIDDFITEYRLTAEVRYIDGAIYLRTELSDDELEAELALGNDWRTITDEDQLIDLQLSEFANLFEATEDSLSTLDMILQIVDVASSITIGEAEIREARYETITFSFRGSDFLTFSGQLVDFSLDDSTFSQVLASQINAIEGDVFSFTLFINEDNQVAGRELELELDITLNGEEIDAELAGGTVTSRTYIFQQEILTDINRPIAPVEVPVN